jgi:hypothetical protein
MGARGGVRRVGLDTSSARRLPRGSGAFAVSRKLRITSKDRVAAPIR